MTTHQLAERASGWELPDRLLLPAFFAVLGNIALFTMLVGPDALAAWLYNLSSFEEIIVTVIILLVIMMVGSPLARALVRDRGVLRRRAVATQRGGVVDPRPTAGPEPTHRACLATPPIARPPIRYESRYGAWSFSAIPRTRPHCARPGLATRWRRGRVSLDHLRHGRAAVVVALDPVLPSYVSDPIEGARGCLGLLNLSLVFGLIACEAVVVLGLVGQQWTAALGVAVAGGVLAWLGYHAAVSQALEVTTRSGSPSISIARRS